jgi:hypothetical protein
MTIYANLDAAQLIDASMQIIPVTGGWVEGPRIKGKIVPPGGTGATSCRAAFFAWTCEPPFEPTTARSSSSPITASANARKRSRKGS